MRFTCFENLACQGEFYTGRLGTLLKLMFQEMAEALEVSYFFQIQIDKSLT